MGRVPGKSWLNRSKFACMLLLVGGFPLIAGARPCAAQSASASDMATDSTYLARMNEGYAAAAAGNQSAAAEAFDRAAQLAPDLPAPRVAAGYALLALKQSNEAATRFEGALRLDENQDIVRRQLGYVYSGAGRNRDALAQFTWLQARDRASAQDLQAIGNLNAVLGERTVALAAFRMARSLAAQLGDSAVLRAARASIAILEAPAFTASDAPGAWIDLYLSPFYQQRFDNVVTYGLAKAGVTSGGWWRPSAYASVRVTRDSKSVGGMQPVLYADNSILPALGLRVQPAGRWFTLYAEAGAAYPLVSASPRTWQRDLRAGVIGAFANTHVLGASPNSLSLVSEGYGDVTWYERFDRNVIGYLQWRESLRLIQGRAGAVDVFARGWGAVDSRGTYYNRVVEGGGGVALHAGANRRASLYIESLSGHYLHERSTGLPERNYSDFRVMFVTGWSHTFPFTAR